MFYLINYYVHADQYAIRFKYKNTKNTEFIEPKKKLTFVMFVIGPIKLEL